MLKSVGQRQHLRFKSRSRLDSAGKQIRKSSLRISTDTGNGPFVTTITGINIAFEDTQFRRAPEVRWVQRGRNRARSQCCRVEPRRLCLSHRCKHCIGSIGLLIPKSEIVPHPPYLPKGVSNQGKTG